jgi:ketosteroid isomerase-like protein
MVDRAPAETVRLFDEAFNRHDLEALGDLITDDCVFEDTTPPDGRRLEGRQSVLAAWGEVMASGSDVNFGIEEMVTAGDRVFVLWRYSWGDGHVRGVDVMRVRGDRVAESFAYVKG